MTRIEKYPEFTLLALTVQKPHIYYQSEGKTKEAYLLRVSPQGEIYFYTRDEKIQLDQSSRELFLKKISEQVTQNRLDFHHDILN